MGFAEITLNISLTREEFIRLLLLCGSVEIRAENALQGHKDETIRISTLSNHRKLGLTGVEEGLHLFDAYLLYQGRLFPAKVSVCTEDGGANFAGSVSFQIYPNDNFSE